MVSRSSTNSTLSLSTSTLVTTWESWTTLPRLNLIGLAGSPEQLPQYQFLVFGDLRFHFLEHFLVRHARAPHRLRVVAQYLPHLFIHTLFHRQLLGHALLHSSGHFVQRLGFNHFLGHQALHHFLGHVRYVIA